MAKIVFVLNSMLVCSKNNIVMEMYIVLLNDANKIHSNQDELVKKCQIFSSTEYAVYHSYNFVEGTGFMKTVGEEIELVLQCYDAENKCFLSFDDFVRYWKLEKYLNYSIGDLSGGWKKFLGLALFTNQISNGKIYFDAARHLSDRLIGLFISNLEKTKTNNVFLFEYDSNLMIKYGFKLLLDSENGFINTTNLVIEDKSILETNYEPIIH